MPPAAAPVEGRSFRPLFDRWASRVRARLALRHALTGAAAGLLVGACATAALWQTRHGALRPVGAAGGLLGAAVGLAVARRRRFSDGDVALYLDARLDADEAVSTSIELSSKSGAGEALTPPHAFVVSQAVSALAGATSRRVRAPFLRPWHAALPVAAAAIGWLSLAPLPPAPALTKGPPGAEKVQLARVAGLEKVIRLAEMNARDDAQRERLKRLADEARRIRDKLRDGVEKREAQADIARMRDAIQAEKLSLGDGEERQGMESALGKLGDDPDLSKARKALGDRDLVSLDEEMERLAAKLEKTDRERAQKALEEAADAARKGGAPGVARALEAERRRLAELGKKTDKLRELGRALGDALGEDGKQALRDLGKSGSPKDEQRLAEKLEDALGKLTPEERKRLADNLKKRASAAPDGDEGPGMSKQKLRDLADQLDTPEGQKQLEDELRKMANEPAPGSEEGDAQKGLGDAEGGAGEAEGEVGGTPMPLPMPGAAASGSGGKGDDKGDATPGHSDTAGGGGPSDHKGVTGVVGDAARDGVRARATGPLDKGRPMPGVVMGRSAGKAGGTANVLGTGALGDAAPGELGGVERSDVPEEYREQVGRYFQPR
jgi:hypothetical protein